MNTRSRTLTGSLPPTSTRATYINPPARRRPTPDAPSSSPVSLPEPSSTETPPASAAPDPTYEVGYKRPPRSGQFKPGQSGNPKGRPKSAKGMKTLARELLTEKIDVRSGGKIRRMTKMEAMLQKVAEQGFSGNLRAIQSAMSLYQMAVPDEPMALPGTETVTDIADLDAHDAAILEELTATLRRAMENDA